MANQYTYPGGASASATQIGLTTQSNGISDQTLSTIIVSKLETIEARLTKLDGIEAQLAEIKASNENYRQKTTADIDRMTAILAESHRQQQETERRQMITEYRMSQAEQTNTQLKMQINDLENRARVCNLKIEGKYEDPNEDLKQFSLDLINYLVPSGIDPAAITSIHRMGKQQPPQMKPGQRHPRPRTILMTVRSANERNAIYFARTKLRDNTNFKMIFLNDDTTPMTRKMREDYRSVAALAQTNGNSVKIHGDGLIIDGRKYRHGEADQLPPSLTLSKAKTIQMNNGIFFSSEHSFLSNFYPAPFIDQGIIYPTAEHRLQAMKCETAGDRQRLELVRTATTPLEAKRIGDQIVETTQWRNGREDMLRTIIDMKFDQHKELTNMLLNTGNLQLHEATTNAFYGIGATLHSRDLRDGRYAGLNRLGLMLQKKRETVRTNRANPTTQQ